jgi:hypothetical protein
MKNDQQVVSKYLRLKMTDELREMIQKIPFISLEETQTSSHIYLGSGKIRSKNRSYPAMIRVWIRSDEIWASIKAFGCGVSISNKFKTVAERRQFINKVLERFNK